MTKAYVIGGATIDLFGLPYQPIKNHESNPGLLSHSFGGVARNIAENLAKLGVSVCFVSALGNDPFGKELLQDCLNLGIDMKHSLILENHRTATYLAILDHQRELHAAVSDMTILSNISLAHLKKVFMKITASDILFMDTNFEPEIINWMLNNAPCPIFIDPISSAKAIKLTQMNKVHTLKPNLQEAQTLYGQQLQTHADLQAIGNYFMKQGLKQLFISLGKDGVYGSTATDAVHMRCNESTVVNATGAGDALMAGLMYQYIHQADLLNTIQFAMATSALTIEHEYSVYPNLTVASVNAKKKKMQFLPVWFDKEKTNAKE